MHGPHGQRHRRFERSARAEGRANSTRGDRSGTQDVALANVAQAITAFPGVKKWLIASCGDEGVLGSVRSMEQAGYASDSLIGVGINGQLGCEEFKKADATGFRGSIARRCASKITARRRSACSTTSSRRAVQFRPGPSWPAI